MPTFYRTERMILRDGPSAAEMLQRMVQEVHAEKVTENFYEPESGIVHEITWKIVPGAEMYSAEDIQSGCTGVVIYGEDESRVSEYSALIRQRLRPLDREELLASATTELEDSLRARMVLRAGFGAPYEFDDQFYSVIRQAMFDASPLVRTAGIYATQYSFWPQYVDSLIRVSREDPEPLLRAEARNLVEAASETEDGNSGGGEP